MMTRLQTPAQRSWPHGWWSLFAVASALALVACGDPDETPKDRPDGGGDMISDLPESDMPDDLGQDMLHGDMIDDMPPVVMEPAPIDPSGGSFSDKFALAGFTGESAARVTSLLTDEDGRLVAGGLFRHVGVTPIANVAVRSADGAWAPLAGGLPFFVESMTKLPDGRLVAGGWDDQDDEIPGKLAVLDQGQWRQIEGEVQGRIFHVSVLPDGKLLVGGEFSKLGGVEVHGAALWDGDAFEPVAPDLFEQGVKINRSLIWEGKLCLVGFFDRAAGQQAGGVVCELPGGWQPLGALPGEVFDMASLDNGDLIAAGSFVIQVAGSEDTFSAGLAKWADGTWLPFEGRGVDGGLINQVRRLLPQEGGAFLMAGQFDVVGQYLNDYGPNTVVAPSVARWSGTQWQALGDGVRGLIGPYAVNVEGGYALYQESVNRLWLGGLFHGLGGGKLGAGLARWEAAQWHPSVEQGEFLGLQGETLSVAMFQGKAHLAGFFGMDFDSSVGVFDGSKFVAMEQGPQGFVRSLLTDPQGRLLVAGSFDVGDEREVNVARWDGTSWQVLIKDLDAPALKIAEHDGAVYAAGYFAGAIMRWRDGQVENLGGLTLTGGGEHMLVAPNGDVFVTGGSLELNGAELRGVARYRDGQWSQLGQVDGFGYGLAWFQGSLLVAGSYLRSGSVEGDILRWRDEKWERFLSLESEDFGSIFFMQTWRGHLYIGGGFQNVGSVQANNLAYTADGVTWRELGGGVDDLTNAIGGDEQALWFCGPYRQAGGKPSFGVARLELGAR